MNWVKRRFAYADYAPYMDHLTKLLFANPTLYREFIMVSTKVDNARDSDCYIGVPNKAFLIGFDGFESVEEHELPKEIDTVLVADQTKDPFTSRFRFRD
jgi:hypothetical protein